MSYIDSLRNEVRFLKWYCIKIDQWTRNQTLKYKYSITGSSFWLEMDKKWLLATNMVKIQSCISIFTPLLRKISVTERGFVCLICMLFFADAITFQIKKSFCQNYYLLIFKLGNIVEKKIFFIQKTQMIVEIFFTR